MLRAILTASIIAAAAFSAAGAHAQDNNSTSVSTRDVDFNKAADVKRLYSRIHAAADEVCAPEGQTTNATARTAKACSAEAVRNAVNDLNQPRLTELAQGRSDNQQMAMRDHRDDEHLASR